MLQFKSDEILEAYYNRFTWALRNASGDATLTQGRRAIPRGSLVVQSLNNSTAAPEPEAKPDEAQILVTAATAYRVKEKIELMDKLAEVCAPPNQRKHTKTFQRS